MKYKIFLCSLLSVFTAFASTMDELVRQNQKLVAPVFASGPVKEFSTLQSAAAGGDEAAQKKIADLPVRHLKTVYGQLNRQGGLLFSVRRPVKGFDSSDKNYAVNIDEFFEKTTAGVTVNKKGFEVHTQTGAVFSVSYPKYKPSEKAIEVKAGAELRWLPLSELAAADRRFVENALADDSFSSSGELKISIDDKRDDDSSYKDKSVSNIHRDTGEKVEGSFTQTKAEKTVRKIVLENTGEFPLGNLVVEYQSFIDQVLMRMPKEFPKEYRSVGFFTVPSLAPGEKKELLVNLPETLDAIQTTISTGSYEYSYVIPPTLNNKSEGRVNGIWVRVHRFTPYGEQLTREYKSAGVPSVEWDCVAPVRADTRK